MARSRKQLFSLTELQFSKLAEQRTHDKLTQEAFAKSMLITNRGGKPKVFLSGFSEFTILDASAPADSERLKMLEKTAIRFKS